MNKKIKNIIKLGIGLAILVLLLYNVGIDKLLLSLKSIKIGWVLIPILLFILIQMFTTLNYKIMINAINKKVKFINLVRYVTFSWAIGNIAPGRLGEFSLVFLLKKKEGIDYGEGLTISLINKILAIIILLIIISMGFYVFIRIELFVLIVAIMVMVIGILTLIIIKKGIRRFIREKILKSYSRYFKGFSKSFIHILKNKKRYLFLNLIVTIFIWMLSFIAVFYLFKAFNFSPSIFHISIISSLVVIISLIPISFSGLGIRESSAVYFYSLIGVPINITANVAIIDTIIRYTLTFIYYLSNHKLLDYKKQAKK